MIYKAATLPNGPANYAARLVSLYGQDPGLVAPWLAAVTSDEVYVNDSWAETDGYVQVVQDALNTYGDEAADQEATASMTGLTKSEAGVYGAASWWSGSMSVVSSLSGGTGGLSTLAYSADPVSYINSLIADYGPTIIDSGLARIPDGEVDAVTLSTAVGVTLTDVWAASLNNDPYLEDQYAYLGNHHLYGSSRLGIASYQPQQYGYRWDYLNGLVDTFEVTKSRPWYSYALAAPMEPGTTSPYGNGLYSTAEGSHVIGMKQYELVNHLSNVQETISDKKWSKDNNGDSARDEYRAVPVMVYDYYPFGQLMPGRSLDTTGLCATYTSYVEVPHFHRPALVALSGNASAYGSASLNGIGSGGVTASGTSGGLSYTLTGITSYYINLELSFAYLSGTSTITVYSGTNTGSGSTILAGPIGISYTSPAVGMPVTVGSSALSSGGGTVTVVVTMPLGVSRPMFTVDSINYMWLTYTLNKTLYTQCGDPKDKYEFGFNGQMKTNEIAGVGNHNMALFWEYDTRLGRRWNLDPKASASRSRYSVFNSNPILNADILGDTVVNGEKIGTPEYERVDAALKLVNERNHALYQRLDESPTTITVTLGDLNPNAADATWKSTPGQKTFNFSEVESIDFLGTSKAEYTPRVDKIDIVNKQYDKDNNPLGADIIRSYTGSEKDAYFNDKNAKAPDDLRKTETIAEAEANHIIAVKKVAITLDAKRNKTSNQLSETLEHEFGHAFFSIVSPVADYIWSRISPKDSRRHSKHDPSGKIANNPDPAHLGEFR